jgi:hypothetical protein
MLFRRSTDGTARSGQMSDCFLDLARAPHCVWFAARFNEEAGGRRLMVASIYLLLCYLVKVALERFVRAADRTEVEALQ